MVWEGWHREVSPYPDQPSLPEEALYPRRLRSIGIALFLSCAVWLIGAFTVQTVREHL